MSDLIKCQICKSDGLAAFASDHRASSIKVYCSNDNCRNSQYGFSLDQWQSVPIMDHPLKDEILELVKSGKVKIS